MRNEKWNDRVQSATEAVLTWRKRRKLSQKRRRQRKSALRDWAEAIGSAVLIVLLLNQYVVQAYAIPSPSMVPALQKGDRVFVDKLVYGPELVPQLAKLPGSRTPERAEVVIFESPEYVSRGPVLDVLQRVVYMLTLSLVDIDRDEAGEQRKHFLIKRVIGLPGDVVRFDKGEIRVRRRGESAWTSEERLKDDVEVAYETVRLLDDGDYEKYPGAGAASARKAAGLLPDFSATGISGRRDDLELGKWVARSQYEINPADVMVRNAWRRYECGIVVGDDEILPLGDNRDSSHDGRYFGPVKLGKVLGRGLFRYWPIGRIGAIR